MNINLGFIMSIIMIRYQNSVKTPQMEKQMVKAMYSIEYSPQRHERYEQHYHFEIIFLI